MNPMVLARGHRTASSSALTRTLLIVALAVACEKKAPPPQPLQQQTASTRSAVPSSAELGRSVDQIRSERGLRRLDRDPELDRLATGHASQLATNHDDVSALGDQVHRALGQHAVAAVDAMELRDASELGQLQGIGMDHWELYGAGAARRADGTLVAAVLYAKRDGWSGTREERKRLRDGIASFHEAFKRLYGNDARWTARWKAGQDEAFEPLYAAARTASGLDADAFSEAAMSDPLLQWQLRRFLLDWSIDFAAAQHQAGGGEVRESTGARGRPLPKDL